MLDGNEWRGTAGDEVRRCIARAARAAAAVDEALREYRSAQQDQEAADRDVDIAKRVYFAGRVDQDRRVRAPKVTPQKMEWLKALADYDVFGAAEMKDAANKIDWSPSPGTLRTLASEYQTAGYFIAMGHGAKRLDKKRIVEGIGDIFENASAPIQQEEPNVQTGDDLDIPAVAAVEPRPVAGPSDELDEDPPF